MTSSDDEDTNFYKIKDQKCKLLKNKNDNQNDRGVDIEYNKKRTPKERCRCENFYNLIQTILNLFHRGRDSISLQLSSDIGINTLPSLTNEIIKEIAIYLDPVSVVRLSHVNRRLRIFFNNDFWMQYNCENNYQVFSEKSSYLFILTAFNRAPALKVMLANYYYEIGTKENKRELIKKSSLLGLPKAQKYFEKKASQVGVTYYSCGKHDCPKCWRDVHCHGFHEHGEPIDFFISFS